MREVSQQEGIDARLHSLGSNPLWSVGKSRDGEGASVEKHPPTDGDHARNHESCSVKQKKPHFPSLNESNESNSDGGYEYSS